MSIQHKEYPGLMIYLGNDGETPKPGAFYAPKQGDNLTKIALAAYGSRQKPLLSASIINRSEYNLGLAKAGVASYRIDSQRCDSPTIKKQYPEEFKKFGLAFVYTYKNGNTRPAGMDKAWLGMCPSRLNAYGSTYPPIWIPTFDGAEPDQLVDSGARSVLPTLPKVRLPGVSTVRPGGDQLPPKADVVLPKTGGGVITGGGTGGAKPGFQKAGVPDWLGWVVLAGLGGGLYYWYRTAKS